MRLPTPGEQSVLRHPTANTNADRSADEYHHRDQKPERENLHNGAVARGRGGRLFARPPIGESGHGQRHRTLGEPRFDIAVVTLDTFGRST